MKKTLGKFQSQEFYSWAGLTKENHLGEAGLLKPQEIPGLMVQLMAYDRGGMNLEGLLSKYPVKEFESEDEYTWNVIGAIRRNIPLAYARRSDGSTVVTGEGVANVGIGGEKFELIFDEDYFGDGEVIVGNFNEVYPIRILGNAKFEGTQAVYTCEVYGNNASGIPADKLVMGQRFSYDYAPVEQEGSRKVGTTRFATPVSMRNEWSRVRLDKKVYGKMNGRKIAFGIPILHKDASGKTVKKTENMWMFHEDWAVEQTFSEYKNNVLAFGVSTRNENGEYMNFGKSGNMIKAGDGLYKQMEAANTIYYSKFSLTLLEQVLGDLLGNRNVSNHTIVIRTGKWGAYQFHKAVLNDVSGWTQFVLDNSSTKVVQRTSSPDHSNALAAGFKFTEWLSPMGYRVKVEVDNGYDDEVRNKIPHSSGVGVAQSYRMDILDMGTYNEPNIFKCKIKGQDEFRGFSWGPFSNPWTGQYNNSSAAYDEDSASVHKMAILGICVLDPTRTVSLIPVELQG